MLFGVGFGMVSQVLTIAIQNAVERSDLGIATASANLFRSLGGSVGVAVFGAIFAGRIDGTLPRPARRLSRTRSPPSSWPPRRSPPSARSWS